MIVVIVVLVFAGSLLALGYDLQAALAAAAGLIAGEVANRFLVPNRRHS